MGHPSLDHLTRHRPIPTARRPLPRAAAARPALRVTPEARRLWDDYALAKQHAEDSLHLEDGRVAAQAFYAFVEAFMPQAFGTNVVPLDARRGRAEELAKASRWDFCA